MLLYYGSNQLIENPIIINSKRTLDFGTGFYLTISLEQAKKLAFIVTKRRNYGKATVSVFETSDLGKLDILKFKGADINWLKYVANNRKNIYQNNNYDLVIGPVANDNTMSVISLYLENVLNEEETVKRLLTQKLKDQYVFKTKKSLEYLKFKEGFVYDNGQDI